MSDNILSGKKGLILGIANEHSIAYGCAKACKEAGAELAITYLNEKTKTYIDPLLGTLQPDIYQICNVTKAEDLINLFERIKEKWGSLDFVIHSIAFAPQEDLHGRLIDCSKEGFLTTLDISCYSFLRIAKLAEPLLNENGSITTMSYYGSEKVIKNYNLMGPVKAMLEACVKYLAFELGSKKISVNAISPGPLKTRAASGINHFEEMLKASKEKSAIHDLINIDDVGAIASFLASDKAKHITGEVIHVDSGYHIIG